MLIMNADGSQLVEVARLYVHDWVEWNKPTRYAVTAGQHNEKFAVSRFYKHRDEASAALRRFAGSLAPDFFVAERESSDVQKVDVISIA